MSHTTSVSDVSGNLRSSRWPRNGQREVVSDLLRLPHLSLSRRVLCTNPCTNLVTGSSAVPTQMPSWNGVTAGSLAMPPIGCAPGGAHFGKAQIRRSMQPVRPVRRRSWPTGCPVLAPESGAVLPVREKAVRDLCLLAAAHDGWQPGALVLVTTSGPSPTDVTARSPAQTSPPNPAAAEPGDGRVLSRPSSRVHEPMQLDRSNMACGCRRS